jgi:hypothetical protein
MKKIMKIKIFLSLLLMSSSLWAAPQCIDLLKLVTEVSTNIKTEEVLQTRSNEINKLTKIEQATNQDLPPLNPSDIIVEKIKNLDRSNPELALKIRQARELKRKGTSLLVDTSHLTGHMINFLEGTYKKVIGLRGLSAPFVSFEKLTADILVIRHEGDVFPLMVKWSSEATEPRLATSHKYKGQVYQMLELPAEFKSKQDLADLSDKFIYSLISGSSLNKYISSRQSDIMAIASILHEGQLNFDRPTQTESKQVRSLLSSDKELRAKLSSLLFVAPTASGKTKVLTDYLISKVKKATELIKGQNTTVNKLTILMTKTPDLTSDLALEVGRQLHEELGSSNFRIIQWGGRLSEEMSHAQLMQFVKDSNVPVVLVTSYPTLGIRSKSPAEKSELLRQANALLIDEAHNATGTVFQGIMKAAHDIAKADRQAGRIDDALDIFGVTASPITREQRTVELYDASFWAGIDKVGTWAQQVKKSQLTGKTVLEWARIVEQYNVARDRGEINASEPIFYKPEDYGFKFSSIFKRSESGTHSSVNIDRLKQIWPHVSEMIEGHGPGVIKTYARDADVIAETLSQLSGKNYVSLQGLSNTARAEVYEAFRNQTEYKGRTVDAIVVARVIEGLDFPKAGWYLSFKKYIKFPENIQDPGRVVRLSLNKLSPKIIFFGEEVDKVAYKDVRELIMKKMGRLPRELPEGVLFSGRRNDQLRRALTESIDNINVAMEAFLRTQFDLAKELGPAQSLKPEKIVELQNILLDMRSSGQNREIAKAVKDLVAQLNSYAFFTGRLDSTWNLCDRLISLDKKGAGAVKRSRLTEAEKEILKNEDLMKQVREFRSILPTIGPVPRALLASLNLRPLNLTELAVSINNFVEVNQKSPFSVNNEPVSLKTLADQAIQNAPDQVWRRLTVKAREVLKDMFDQASQKTFEQSLEAYFADHREIPEFTFDNIDNPNRTTADYIARKLSEELIIKMKEGDLDLRQLSPSLLAKLEQTDTYNGLMLKTIEAIKEVLKSNSETDSVYLRRLRDSGNLTYDNLARSGDLRILQVLKEMSLLDPTQQGVSAQYKKLVDEALEQAVH